ncbi:dolichyl-phosphate-mannose--protein mannosyltransferase [Metallococcus carri]|uniref:dolichyl-phosphate-mannose--protein mannosyltransferase n=1 Tax=Metallococcus carri TaxID=1656884 RepID=UPI002E2AF8AF|nr:phospholipid carrier-dependent glycosyltransferase [Metallococcus carri]
MSSELAERTALRRRLLGRPRTAQEKLWGWLGPAIVTVIGGIMRFWQLGRPHQLIFDETYYVKQGWAMTLFGYEMKPTSAVDQAKSADSLFTMGHATQGVWGTEADFVVHPPLGKWLIGGGERLFGIDSSFGWRFAVALVGTLAIYLVGRAAWHLFRSPVLATLASLLLCFEGAEFVMSRTGILDVMVMFFALAAFVALLADRDRSRRILADKVAAMKAAGTWTGQRAPWLGLRPWRWVAGVMIGLDCGVKWSGGYFLVVFGLMSVWWDLGARRAVGTRHWVGATFLKDALFAMVAMVPTAVVVYLATWIGWFRSTDAYDRTWASLNPADGKPGLSPTSSTFAWLPDSLRSLWQYHIQMYDAAVGITSPHDYMSNPWSWMLQTRPTSFFYEGSNRGQAGCTVAQCSKAITSLGTPLIWWAGTIALAVLLFQWLLHRDWRAAAILGGIAAGWLPWFTYQQRTIFTFYSVAFSPYVVLGVVFVCGLVLGSRSASRARRRVGTIAVGVFTTAAVAMFIFFWPIYTAQLIPYSHWQWRMWFPSWI